MPDVSVAFSDRAFCFTGKLVDLKRAVAEREVRSRGGLILDRINERLDYLVIGDEASPAWKFGGYGRKIEQARDIHRTGRSTPLFISESVFMEALATSPTTNTGDIDEKVVVCNYKFLLSDPAMNFDQDAVQSSITGVAEQFPCHTTVKASWAAVHRDLFGDHTHSAATAGALVIEYRFVRHQTLDSSVVEFVNAVSGIFEPIAGIDGTLRWFERTEGSADFVRLLQEVPQSLRVTLT